MPVCLSVNPCFCFKASPSQLLLRNVSELHVSVPHCYAGVTWERNGQSLFSTSKEGGACRVQPHILLGRPAVTQHELEAVTCAEDETSVRVTIRNVTVSPRGDRWICSKFPFLESNAVSLRNFGKSETKALWPYLAENTKETFSSTLLHTSVQCCFQSTERPLGLLGTGEPRTATSTFAQLLSSD